VAGEGQVSFERLEYGKLCKSHDGPIEPRVESYPLATSPGFSSLVEPFCRPWLVGVGADLVPGAHHGTVLRCVRLQGLPVPLFCRLRQRPEGGEGAEGRRFWLGRYVYAGSIDPLTGFNALEARPLRGITVQEARARQWAPISVPRSPRPDAPDLPGFLPTALEHVLSGIPVGVSAAPDEETFFRWAAALWYLLPPPLRPVFSVGWAVTPAQAQDLCFSWSPERAPTVALVDVDRGTWTAPDRVEQHTGPSGEVRARAFQDELLVPGRMFLRESFDWTAGHPQLAGLSPRLDHLRGFDYVIRGAETETSWVVDARAPWTWDRFRRPGMRSLDHARFQLVEHWLQDGVARDPAALCLSTKEFFFPDSRRRLLELGLGALETPAQRPRADQIVWRSLAEDPASHPLLDEIPLPEREASRVRLLQALALGDLRQILDALANARELGGADDLPPVALERLQDALTQSLDDPALLDSHRHLLGTAQMAEPYRGWAMTAAIRLAVLLATARESGNSAALERLRKLASHPVLSTLRRLQKSEPPTTDDVQALGSLDSGAAALLGRRLLALWKHRDLDTRKVRETLCPWLQALGPPSTGDPLISLLARSPGARLTPEQRDTLAEEIRSDHVPPALQPRVAAVVLHEWVHFRSYHQADGQRSAGWNTVLRQWAVPAVHALTDAVPGTGARPEVDPEVDEALARLSLPSSFLDRRIALHLQRRKDFRLFGEVARLLWDLCERAVQHPGEVCAADLCRGLIRGELPKGDPTPPEEAKLDTAVRLASPHLTSLPHGLWERSTQGWQIRFVLEAAPRAGLQPTTEQLVALLPFRPWLRRHLDQDGIHPDRERTFSVASYSFHQMPYDPKQWRPAYEQSPLWAAFRGVPLSRQGDLRKALETYGVGDSHFVQSLVRNATTYFQEIDFPYLEPEQQRDVLERLARAVIAPLMRDGGLSSSDASPLIAAGNQNPRQRGEVQFHEDAYNALDAADGGIVVATWFKPLLIRIWHRGCQNEMVKAIQRVAPEVWRR
jgi:hypothetical protein